MSQRPAFHSPAVWNEFIERTYDVVRRLPHPRLAEDTDRSVVMIEPRQHPHLDYVLRNVLHFLGEGWGLELFVGKGNRRYVEEITASWGHVAFHDIDSYGLSTVEYNRLKKLPDTWRRIRAEHTLWIEPDCLLCRPGIDEFMTFDYVGAPWADEFAVSPSCRVGNGGLSLRNKSSMLSIAERANNDHRIILSEDVFFVVNMCLCNAENPGTYRVADYETAKSFAVESVYYPTPLGIHKVWMYHSQERVMDLLNQIEY